MKKFLQKFKYNLWFFSICCALFLGVVGPFLLSAQSDLAVGLFLVLMVLMARWAFIFGVYYANNKFTNEKESQ